MPLAELGKSALFYELTGTHDGCPLVLIQGFGAQMIAWNPGFCELLGEAGFAVVRFDNRDVGLSRKFDGQEAYSLLDMAGDVADLIDFLDRGPAHVLGQSMGGMIAQRVALAFPERVASLCLVYTTPSKDFITDDPEFLALVNSPAARTRHEAIERFVHHQSFAGTNGVDVRDLGERAYDRCYCPEGVTRQWSAIQSSESLLAELHTLDMPTAVIHGRADRLISGSASVAIAEAVPTAELHLYAELGHEIPPWLWTEMVQVISRTAERASA